MKRGFVSFGQSRVIDDEEAKAKIKYQTLVEEYLELQKEYVSRKRKLQATKQKRETISAEVRFLKRKHKCLLKSQAPKTDVVPFHLPNSNVERNTLEGGRNQSASEAAPEKFDQVLVSNSCPENEEEEGSAQMHKKDVSFAKKLKNRLIQNKGVGKRKICWPDQVTLKV